MDTPVSASHEGFACNAYIPDFARFSSWPKTTLAALTRKFDTAAAILYALKLWQHWPAMPTMATSKSTTRPPNERYAASRWAGATSSLPTPTAVANAPNRLGTGVHRAILTYGRSPILRIRLSVLVQSLERVIA